MQPPSKLGCSLYNEKAHLCTILAAWMQCFLHIKWLSSMSATSIATHHKKNERNEIKRLRTAKQYKDVKQTTSCCTQQYTTCPIVWFTNEKWDSSLTNLSKSLTNWSYHLELLSKFATVVIKIVKSIISALTPTYIYIHNYIISLILFHHNSKMFCKEGNTHSKT